MQIIKFRLHAVMPLFLLLGVTVFLILPPAAHGDQNDPALDGLFEQLQRTDNFETADEITKEIWRIWRQSPDDEINRLMRTGVIAMSSGQFNRAINAFDQIIHIDASFAEGWNKRATVYFLMGDYQRSTADVEKTLQLEPRHFGAAAGLGLILMNLGYYEEALQAFRKALEINPHLVGPKMRIKRLESILSGRVT